LTADSVEGGPATRHDSQGLCRRGLEVLCIFATLEWPTERRGAGHLCNFGVAYREKRLKSFFLLVGTYTTLSVFISGRVLGRSARAEVLRRLATARCKAKWLVA
jgi:hypothetical protein